MHLFDTFQIDKQKAVFAAIEAEPTAWLFSRWQPADTSTGLFALARKVQKALIKFDGSVFVEDKKTLLLLVKRQGEDDPATALSGLDITLQPLPADTAKLIGESLENIAGNSRLRNAPSTLYQQRAARKKNMTIVVEDDKVSSLILEKMLGKYGTCIALDSGETLIDTYIEHTPDCLFLDNNLPGLSGLQLLDLVVEIDKDAHIIMLTDESTAQRAAAAKTGGAKSFLAKPCSPSRVEYELFNAPTFKRYTN